jgi:DNA-binding response OmpR family regulator
MEDILLLIEDEPMVAEFVQTLAEDAGYRVELAESLKEIENSISAVKPSVILLDLNLPGVKADDILQYLAHCDIDAHIFVTSGSDIGRINAMLEQGKALGLNMHSAIPKPFDIVKLETILEELRH